MVDMRKKLRISSFMDLAQQIAEDDSESRHYGYDDLIRNNDVWILSRMRIGIGRMPEFKERVGLKTWHERTEGPYFIRKYELDDENGNTLVESDSAWAIMNLEGRTVVRPSKYDIPDNAGSSLSGEIPPKIRIPENAVLVSATSHLSRYSDIDYNFHVNNVKYLIWAMDALGDVPYDRDFSELTLNFNHEIKPSEEADIEVFEHDGALYVQVNDDGRQAFIAMFR